MEQAQPEFFNEWLSYVDRFLSPEKIIVVDSASPMKPVFDDDRIEFISLTENFLRAMHCTSTKYCGWSRAFLMGAFYALMNDMDYVFIEQDVLFRGDIVGTVFQEMEENGKTYAHGLWSHRYRVEQSLVMIRHLSILRFMNEYMAIRSSDGKMRPEQKFDEMSKRMNLHELPFGYGRQRPVNFDDEVFYLQQLSPEELKTMREIL